MACVTYARAASPGRRTGRPAARRCRGTSPHDGAPERRRRRRWLGGSGTRLVTLLEELQRTPQPTHGGVEHRLADERQLGEQLQGVPQVLAGSLEGGIALGAAAALQGAASLRASAARWWTAGARRSRGAPATARRRGT